MMPRSMPIVVVLPPPLGPRNPKIWPGSTLNVTASTAKIFRNRLVGPVVSITLKCARRREGMLVVILTATVAEKFHLRQRVETNR